MTSSNRTWKFSKFVKTFIIKSNSTPFALFPYMILEYYRDWMCFHPDFGIFFMYCFLVIIKCLSSIVSSKRAEVYFPQDQSPPGIKSTLFSIYQLLCEVTNEMFSQFVSDRVVLFQVWVKLDCYESGHHLVTSQTILKVSIYGILRYQIELNT